MVWSSEAVVKQLRLLMGPNCCLRGHGLAGTFLRCPNNWQDPTKRKSQQLALGRLPSRIVGLNTFLLLILETHFVEKPTEAIN